MDDQVAVFDTEDRNLEHVFVIVNVEEGEDEVEEEEQQEEHILA